MGWVRGRTEASEPGDSCAITEIEEDADVLRVAFYNVGLPQSALDATQRSQAEERLHLLCDDIMDAFTEHKLDTLLLCGLGENEVGLRGSTHFNCPSQAALLRMIVRRVNKALVDSGASASVCGAHEPALQVELVAGLCPTFAAMKRCESKLEIDEQLYVSRLDYIMMIANCRWMGKPVKISNAHCPLSEKRSWDRKRQNATLPMLFKDAGLKPYKDWSQVAEERVAWILGGDLILTDNLINNEMACYQPPRGGEGMVQVVKAGSLIERKGDHAFAQHLDAFQTQSGVGEDYGGVSAAHNMVVMVAKSRSSSIGCAPELSAHAPEPEQTEFTTKAMEAAAALATALETTPPQEQFEMRKARDGYLYTMEAFQEHYGKHGVSEWEQAEDIGATEPDGAIARDRDGIIGRALWPRETPKIALVSRNGIMVAAAICTPAAVIAELFKTLLRVRQAEFAAQAGFLDPDAWDTDAAEPGVDIDVDRPLSDEEFGSAWGRWRQQWSERVQLLPRQEAVRKNAPHAKFMNKARSWFEAWLQKWLGDRHVARAIVRFGVSDAHLLASLRENVDKERREEKAAKRKRWEEMQDGAEEPVWMLRARAKIARKKLRQAQSMSNKIQNNVLDIEYLSDKQKTLLEELDTRKLHFEVDRANEAYGHGVARTHVFGFTPGENMRRDIPMEIRAHLRQLRDADV